MTVFHQNSEIRRTARHFQKHVPRGSNLFVEAPSLQDNGPYTALDFSCSTLQFSASYGPEQHGFRHGASTTTALLQLTDDVTSMFDDATNTDMAVLSFDMSCAFDNVDHNSLLSVMSNNGFPTGFIARLCNYLSDRSGFVLNKMVASH